MPAKSKAQRQAAAIALHNPEQLHARNRSLKKMNLEDLAHFAETPEKGLPKHTKKNGRR